MSDMLERESPCVECPHLIIGEAIIFEEEMDELEAMALRGERHECHLYRSMVCIGQITGCFAVIESKAGGS